MIMTSRQLYLQSKMSDLSFYQYIALNTRIVNVHWCFSNFEVVPKKNMCGTMHRRFSQDEMKEFPECMDRVGRILHVSTLSELMFVLCSHILLPGRNVIAWD